VPVLCEVYPGICLTSGERAWKNLSQGSRRVQQRIHVISLLSKIFLLRLGGILDKGVSVIWSVTPWYDGMLNWDSLASNFDTFLAMKNPDGHKLCHPWISVFVRLFHCFVARGNSYTWTPLFHSATILCKISSLSCDLNVLLTSWSSGWTKLCAARWQVDSIHVIFDKRCLCRCTE
jgi:hypothetical protein